MESTELNAAKGEHKLAESSGAPKGAGLSLASPQQSASPHQLLKLPPMKNTHPDGQHSPCTTEATPRCRQEEKNNSLMCSKHTTRKEREVMRAPCSLAEHPSAPVEESNRAGSQHAKPPLQTDPHCTEGRSLEEATCLEMEVNVQ